MPVGVVVSLLRALVPTSVTIGILTSVSSRGTAEVLVGSEESHVPAAELAVSVIVKVLVHAKLKILVAIIILAVDRTVRNRAIERERATSMYTVKM